MNSTQFSTPIVIPMEDEITHTAENGYHCNDSSCPCNAAAYYEQLRRRYPVDADTCFGSPEEDQAQS